MVIYQCSFWVWTDFAAKQSGVQMGGRALFFYNINAKKGSNLPSEKRFPEYRRGTGLLQIALHSPDGTVDGPTNPRTEIVF